MKLSWRDVLSSLFVVAGGAVVYAKIQEYSWWLIGDSWRWSTVVVALLGLAAFLAATYRAREEGTKRNLFDDVDIGIGLIAAGVAAAGVIFASEFLFYTFAAIAGALWLTAMARRLTHTISSDTYRHVSAH